MGVSMPWPGQSPFPTDRRSTRLEETVQTHRELWMGRALAQRFPLDVPVTRPEAKPYVPSSGRRRGQRACLS
jgi:hypothetical protein